MASSCEGFDLKYESSVIECTRLSISLLNVCFQGLGTHASTSWRLVSCQSQVRLYELSTSEVIPEGKKCGDLVARGARLR